MREPKKNDELIAQAPPEEEPEDIFTQAKEQEPAQQQQGEPEDIFTQAKEGEPAQQQPEIDETTWMEAVGGLRPDRLGVSFGKGAWETIRGVPQLPLVAWQLAMELGQFSHGDRRREASGQRSNRQRRQPRSVRNESMRERRGKGNSVIDVTPEKTPLLWAIFQDYKDRFGSLEGFKKALKEDPFSILSEFLPLLAKAGKLGKLGRYSKLIEKSAEYADPTNIIGTAVKGTMAGVNKSVKGIAESQRGKQYKQSYNPKVDDTGKTVLEHAGEAGLSKEDVPAMILSDHNTTRKREGVQYRSEDQEVSNRTRARFEKSEEAIQNRGRELGGFTDTEGVDIEQAGRDLLNDFDEVQDGFKGDFKDKFGELESKTFRDADGFEKSVMDMEVRPRTITGSQFDPIDEVFEETFVEEWGSYFDTTLMTLLELRKTDSKLLLSSEYLKLKEIFEGVLDRADDSGFTIRDMDRLRTNFRRQLDVAVRNGEISAVGAGEVSTKIYAALTQDFYDTLEQTVRENPDAFDADFVMKLRDAKRDYRAVMGLLDTEGAKYLMRNQFKPTTLVNHILTRMETGEIDNIKSLLTDEGWEKLQPALISSILDRSLRAGEWSPGGLKKTLASLGDRRLRYLFGDDKLKQLKDLAAFSDRFSRRNYLTSDALNDVVARGSMEDFGWKVANTLGPMGIGGIVFGTGGGLNRTAGATAVSAISIYLVRYIGQKKLQKFLETPEGRKWMTEGTWELTIRIPGEKFVKIIPQDLRRALAYTARTTQRAKDKQKDKRRQEYQNRRTRGFGFGQQGFQRPVQ